MSEQRVRVTGTLGQQIHQYAVREGRSFDDAGRRLIQRGLDATRAPILPRPAPQQRPMPRSVPEIVAAHQDLGRELEQVAAQLAHHIKSVDHHELRAFLHRLHVATCDWLAATQNPAPKRA